MAEGFTPRDQATVVVRPEHARLVAGDADLSGTVEDIVYFGTDTNVGVRLADGTIFTIRQQNARSGPAPHQRGDAVGIAIAADAAQILRD